MSGLSLLLKVSHRSLLWEKAAGLVAIAAGWVYILCRGPILVCLRGGCRIGFEMNDGRPHQRAQSMKFSQATILVYGALYFVLASAMEAENINQNYPLVYVGFSMLTQILVVAGVVLFGLNAGAGFAHFWRWFFPLMILEVVVGLWFDATIPPNTFQQDRFFNVGLSLWLMAPAYYFNFRVAQYREAERKS